MNRLFALFGIVLRFWWALLVVTVRRWFVGPRFPGWRWRHEAIAEVARRQLAWGVALPVSEMRRFVLPSPVHPRIRQRVAVEPGTLAGRPTEVHTPRGWSPGGAVTLYLHGGAYIVCSPATHRGLISRIADATGTRCIAIDYRMAPEHPFPQPIDDCEAAYRELLAAGQAPDQLIVAGDSAGGGLTLATLLRVRDAGLPLPAAAVLLSPWVDLTSQGGSLEANRPFDYLPAGSLSVAVDYYLQGAAPEHPHASPLKAELSGLPPLLMLTGSAELLLTQNCQLAERVRAAGVRLIHQIEPGMVHVWVALADLLPEARRGIARLGEFVRAHLEGRAELRPAGELVSAPAVGGEALLTGSSLVAGQGAPPRFAVAAAMAAGGASAGSEGDG